LHATILVAALVVWPYVAPPIELTADIVPVELLDPSDETNVAPQEKAEEPPPEPQQIAMPDIPPPPPPEFTEPPPPPLIEDEAPALEPEEKPEETKPEPKPAPPQQRFAMATPRAKPKPEKPKEEFDINKILNKIDQVEKQQAQADTKAPPAATRTVKAAGAASAMTVSEIDALRSQMSKCWNVPVGAPDPTALVLRVRVFLNEDGTVASPPQLVDQARVGDPYFRAAADAAIRAVHVCGPYNLPPEKYASWNEIVITFDPRQMAGY
jgi:outer membrane biosynthesis protein TonB